MLILMIMSCILVKSEGVSKTFSKCEEILKELKIVMVWATYSGVYLET